MSLTSKTKYYKLIEIKKNKIILMKKKNKYFIF